MSKEHFSFGFNTRAKGLPKKATPEQRKDEKGIKTTNIVKKIKTF